MKWERFKRTYAVPEQQKRQVDIAVSRFPEDQQDRFREYMAVEAIRTKYYRNHLYQVTITPADTDDGWPEMLHLSIKRIDKQPIRTWRHLQRIKNELVGKENEAVELFPAESRLVDSANQYHLFVLVKSGTRFPFGFRTRLIDGESDLELGTKQEPFDDDDKKEMKTDPWVEAMQEHYKKNKPFEE